LGIVSISRALGQTGASANSSDLFRLPQQLAGDWEEESSRLTIRADGSYTLREQSGGDVIETTGQVICCRDLLALHPAEGRRDGGSTIASHRSLREEEVAERLMTFQWQLDRDGCGHTHLVFRPEETGAPIRYSRAASR
jgi:hypothetical protein